MSQDNSPNSGGRNLNFLFIVGLVIAILTVIFAIQNSETVPIEFFSFKVEPHLALLIISCIAVGSLLTLLFSIPGWWRRRKARAEVQAELKELRRKYEDLAAIQHRPTNPEAS